MTVREGTAIVSCVSAPKIRLSGSNAMVRTPTAGDVCNGGIRARHFWVLRRITDMLAAPLDAEVWSRVEVFAAYWKMRIMKGSHI